MKEIATLNLSNTNGLPETVSAKLDRLEAGLAKIGTGLGSQGAVDLLTLMDEINLALKEAVQNGVQMRAEEAQFEAAQALLKREARPFLHEIRAELEKQRTVRRPAPDQWWWNIDSWLVEKGKKTLQRSLFILGGVVAVLAILGVVYKTFFAPDPALVARFSARQGATQWIERKEPAKALAEVEQVLTQQPGNAELLLMKGSLLQIQGDAAGANAAFAEAEKGYSDHLSFLLSRSQLYLTFYAPQAALDDADAAIAIDSSSAVGYFLKGSAHEVLTQYKQASAAYERAAALASEQNNIQLEGQVRTKMAFMTQMMSSQLALPTAQPTKQP